MRKTYFLAPKWEGRLIHGIHLYMGKHGNIIVVIIVIITIITFDQPC